MQTSAFRRHALLPKRVRATDLASIVAEAELKAKAVLRVMQDDRRAFPNRDLDEGITMDLVNLVWDGLIECNDMRPGPQLADTVAEIIIEIHQKLRGSRIAEDDDPAGECVR